MNTLESVNIIDSNSTTIPATLTNENKHIPSTSTSSNIRHRRRPRILIGLTGSVATVKYQELCIELSKYASIRIICTEKAFPFLSISQTTYQPDIYTNIFQNRYSIEEYETKEDIPKELLSLYTDNTNNTINNSSSYIQIKRPLSDILYTDTMEWSSYHNVHQDAVLHIELRKWADILLIAPCSANTLSKLSYGLCDNLLTTIIRAWEFQIKIPSIDSTNGMDTLINTSSLLNNTSSSSSSLSYHPLKPLIIAPAMNTAMYNHPLTYEQLNMLKHKYQYTIILPQSNKKLACGDIGSGAMASVETIVSTVKIKLEELGWK